MIGEISFGRWLQRRRTQLGLTPEELAVRAHCSVITLRQMEQGRHRPSEELAHLLANVLAIPTAEHSAFVLFARSDLPSVPAGEIDEDAPWHSYRPATNLPAQRASFIGREQEVSALTGLLRQSGSRLVTVKGVGGIGKTSLALKVAGELLGDFEDGVYFIPLASITDLKLVVPTIASTLGIAESSQQSHLEGLKSFLRSRRVLLVLDNFEQILQASPVIADLLTTAPNLKVLVTSRASLRMMGEQAFEVRPMKVPDVKNLPATGALAQYEAVALFVERTLAVLHGFRLNDENARTVAALCTRLDGLPLAIELAAARTNEMSLQTLTERLSRSLQVLVGGPTDLPAKHQTLRGTIDWSYNLLEENAQTLFRRMAVFVGGCTLEAVERVCNWDGAIGADALQALESLVDNSLVYLSEPRARQARYGMLETIREYALERLVDPGEAQTARQQHAQYYLALTEQAEPDLKGPKNIEAFQRLDSDYDNIRASLRWFFDNHNVLGGARIAAALVWFWYLRGYWSEGRRWLGETDPHIEELGRTPTRVSILYSIGALGFLMGDDAAGRPYLEQSVMMAREIADNSGLAYALHIMATANLQRGDVANAYACWQESIAAFRQMGDMWGLANATDGLGILFYHTGAFDQAKANFSEVLDLSRKLDHTWGESWTLNNMGKVMQALGDNSVALSCFTRSEAMARALGAKRYIALALESLGKLAASQHDVVGASRYYRECIQVFEEIGEKAGVAACLEGMAGVASQTGQARLAARLCAAASALREAIAAPIAPVEFPAYEQTVAGVRAELDDKTWEEEAERGRALTFEQAVACATQLALEITDPTRAAAATTLHDLTRREVEVLHLLSEGLSNQELAARLFLTANTVRAHLYSIYNKLNVETRTAAVQLAREYDLV